MTARPHDRRQAPRRYIDLNEKVLGKFVWNGQDYHLRLVSISKSGLAGLLDTQDHVELLPSDGSVIDMTLNSPRLTKDIAVQQLHLLRVEMVDEHVLKLIFRGEAESTKAQLWQVGFDLDQINDCSLMRQRIEDAAIPKIPGRGHYTEESRIARIEFIRQRTQQALPGLERFDLVAERLSSNIENLVGSVEIPVGLAGPLLFHGSRAQGMVFAPLATTEGALVASATRGATAMTKSGGVTTRVISQQMIRVPFFRFKDLSSSLAFCRWIADHFSEIRGATQTVSRFSNLIKLDPLVNGSSVHVRFIYETGDAAGQNMTTTCTWHACLWILDQIKRYPSMHPEHFMIDGNVSGDKKVNYMSFLQGRGMRVTAECFIYGDELEKVLKVTPKNLVKAYHLIALGATKIGMVGVNVNIANIIAAIFAATGQDIASVHESSLGILNIEEVEGGVYASLLLPSLIIGTVGGGTGLPDQNEYLRMIDCAGSGQAARLAEIIAGFCLALDISTLSALSSGQFATAHEKMGRNRPVQFLQESEFTSEFFQGMLAKGNFGPIDKVEFLPKLEGGSSIITELTNRRLSKTMGLYPLRFFQKDSSFDALAKVKALDTEVLLMMNTIASMCHPTLTKAFRLHHAKIGFQHCHIRELAIYQQQDPRFLEFSPQCYGTMENKDREIYILLLENISSLYAMNSVETPQIWKKDTIKAVIFGLASLHAIWWKKDHELLKKPWIATPMSSKLMLETKELWETLGIHAAQEFPEWYSPDMLHSNHRMISSMGDWWGELDKMPKTLIHNDFNPRNIALRKTPQGYKLCAYDWELASIHVPQHDLAEFFLFNASMLENFEDLMNWVEMHRVLLSENTQDNISPKEWRKGFALCVRDLVINRVGLYIMAHTLHHYKFIKRVVYNGQRLMDMTRHWLDD